MEEFTLNGEPWEPAIDLDELQTVQPSAPFYPGPGYNPPAEFLNALAEGLGDIPDFIEDMDGE